MKTYIESLVVAGHIKRDKLVTSEFGVDVEGKLDPMMFPNLLRSIGVHDAVGHYLTAEDIDHMFNVFLKARNSHTSDQLVAFQKLKNVLFKMERFDNKIFEGDLAKIDESYKNKDIRISGEEGPSKEEVELKRAMDE